MDTADSLVIPASLVILSGGRSSRMKENKALVKVGGRRIIDIILDRFRPAFADIMIISNNPEPYADLGLPVYPDVYPFMGPVAGIHSGLVHAQVEVIFVIGCDMPFLTLPVAEYMLSRLGSHQAALPILDGHLQPLSAVYHRSCLPYLESCLSTNRLKLVRVFEALDHQLISAEELAPFGRVEELLMNVNDPVALEKAQNIFSMDNYFNG